MRRTLAGLGLGLALALPAWADSLDDATGFIDAAKAKLDGAQLDLDAAKVKIDEARSPLPPVTQMDHYDVVKDTATPIDPLANDADPNTPALTPLMVRNMQSPTAAGGTATGTNYEPPPGYVGLDDATYEACNTAGLCTLETIHFEITDPGAGDPLAGLDPYVPAVLHTWAPIGGTAIAPLFPAGLPFCAEIECNAAYNVIAAWNGGAYDPIKHVMYIAAAGGHAAYGGNESYGFDFENPAWSLLIDPVALSGPNMTTPPPDCPMPANGPPAFHTYNGSVIAKDRLCVFGTVGYCDAGFTGNETHQTWCIPLADLENPPADPLNANWVRYTALEGANDFINLSDYARAARLTETGNILVISRDWIAEVDPDMDPVKGIALVRERVRAGGFNTSLSYGTGDYYSDGTNRAYYAVAESTIYRVPVTPGDYGATPPVPTVFGEAETLPVTVPANLGPRATVVADPTASRLIFWGSHRDVSFLSVPDHVWTHVTPGTGPESAWANRAYDRCAIIEEKRVLACYPTDENQPMWLFKL